MPRSLSMLRRNGQLLFALLILAMLRSLSAEEAKSPDEVRRVELGSICARWNLAIGRRNGNEIPQEVVERTRIELTESGQFTFQIDGEVEPQSNLSGQFELRLGTIPRAIDLRIDEGECRGATVLGIYEADWDVDESGAILRLAFARPGQERPRSFAEPSRTGEMFLEVDLNLRLEGHDARDRLRGVLLRAVNAVKRRSGMAADVAVEPSKVPVAPTTEITLAQREERAELLRNLEFEWELYAEFDGESLYVPSTNGAQDRVIVKDGRYKAWINSRVYSGSFRIDWNSKPMAADLFPDDGILSGMTLPGIVRFKEGERLQVVLARPGRPRPGDWECEEGSGHISLHLDRDLSTAELRLKWAMSELSVLKSRTDRVWYLDEAAEASLELGKIRDAKQYATELFELASILGRRGRVYDANSVLGRVALRENRMEDAKGHLLLLAEGLDRWNPNMSLAKEMLERGESAAVLEFLAACRKSWKNEKHAVLLTDRWIQEVQAGQVPTFGRFLDAFWKHP